MPNHVHFLFSPMINQKAQESYSLAEIMDGIKGASAHKINLALERRGHVWQEESFDHVYALPRVWTEKSITFFKTLFVED